MRVLLRGLLLTGLLTALGGDLAAQPPEGSQLPPDQNACAMCHGTADLWKEDSLRLHTALDQFADDAHWQKGVNCHDCHGGNPRVFDPSQLHAVEDGFRELGDVKKACANCHQEQAGGLISGVHARAGENDEGAPNGALACTACHGENQHRILAVGDRRSGVFLDRQVETCGGCHQGDWKTYRQSAHGYGLYQSGLLTTAACADCHGSHGIRRAPDPQSKLHPTKVSATCGRCHRLIEEELERSVHGRDGGEGGSAHRETTEGKAERKPACTDCHQGHDLPHAGQLRLRLALPHRCGNCHPDLSDHYSLSVHGELTELGYGPAATCSDCHGAHAIWSLSDPRSGLSPQNRLTTCRGCHANVRAAGNFLDFNPHADHRDAEDDPVLYGVYLGFLTLLVTVFGLFGLHCLLWFTRSLLHVLKHGRPRGLVPGAAAYRRFGPFHRVVHLVLMVSFLGLALTGLPLKYSQHPWAKWLARQLGGFPWTGVWHRVFAVLLFACFFACILGMLRAGLRRRKQGGSWREVILGPDSPLPNRRDLKDLAKMTRWFLGLGPRPTFDRWTYWEKFDFWGACADVVIIGVTGLILWFPVQVCMVLPGSAINIAKVIHSTQALLATGFVFAVHFFNAHVRPDKFPADLSVSTGLVSEEELQEERPEWYARMAREGGLEGLGAVVPSAKRLWLYRLAGFVALAIGVGLLAGIVFASLSG